jgi:hypothetical protein
MNQVLNEIKIRFQIVNANIEGQHPEEKFARRGGVGAVGFDVESFMKAFANSVESIEQWDKRS